MRKTFVTGLVSAALIGVGVGFASPAHATTLVNNGNGTVAVSGLNAANDLVHLCASTVSATTCANELLGDGVNVAVISVTQGDGTYGVGSTVFVAAGSVTGPLAAGTYTMVPFSNGQYFPGTELLNVVIGGGASDGATSQPQTVAVSINSMDGSSCRRSSETGIAGTWINLPGADFCTVPESRAGAKLLGWATNPNFPVEIAQRQISNRWGAYEMFSDEGRLTAVFIPAGGAAFLSIDGNLFAIWSQ